jgi:uncharacterized membrane protein
MTWLRLLHAVIFSMNLALLSGCVPTTDPAYSATARTPSIHEGGEGGGGGGAGAGGAGGAGAAGHM